MREHILELVGTADSVSQGVNIAREYLQARILASLQRSGAMASLAMREALSARLHTVPWPQVRADVLPFLQTGAEVDLLTAENLDRLLAV